MKLTWKISSFALVLVLASLACSALPLGQSTATPIPIPSNIPLPTSTPSPIPTDIPLPLPTATATPVPTATIADTVIPIATDTPEAVATIPGGAIGTPIILFQDDFSSVLSGWSDLYRDETGMTDYDQGGFRIQVIQTQFDYWANPNLSFTDVRVEVDATNISSHDNNDFGVICRYTDSGNFYFLLGTSDGYYAIGKYTDSEQSIISGENYLPTDTTLSGNATNHIRGDCVGNTLSLFINGTFVDSVTDNDHTFGDVGLMAGTFDEPGADILFDNFFVYQP